MPEQFSRRTLLGLAAGATTTALSGCAGLSNSEAKTTTVDVGKPIQLDDDHSITVHDIWIQQTFIYREGPYKSIGGTSNSQLVCLYASGGIKDGSFALQVENAEYNPTTRPNNPSIDRILQTELETTPPDTNSDTSLVIFEVPQKIDTDFVEIVYQNSTQTVRWGAADSVRARLHFPPNLSLAKPDLPPSLPTGEQATLETTLKNTGGSDATAHVRQGILENTEDFPLQSKQIDSGESATYRTTVTPTEEHDKLTYIFDWGIGYYQHKISVQSEPDDSSNEDGTDDGSTY